MNRSEVKISEPWALAYFDSGYKQGHRDGLTDKRPVWRNRRYSSLYNLEPQRWVDVINRLPVAGKTVLCLDRFGKIDLGTYSYEGDFSLPNQPEKIKLFDVTHWMKLPEREAGDILHEEA